MKTALGLLQGLRTDRWRAHGGSRGHGLSGHAPVQAALALMRSGRRQPSGQPIGHSIGMVAGALTTLVIGAGLALLFDPVSGRRRRALARDKVGHVAHVAGDTIGTTSRHVRNRMRGWLAGIRSRLTRGPVSDSVLAERVRARLGGVASHPRAIDVTVTDGRVALHGPVPAGEVDAVLSRVAAVSGVRSVDDRLEAQHDRGVSAFQGASVKRRSGEVEL